MVTALEKRWAAYDQELYVLAYVLNPARRDKLFNPNCMMVSWLNLLSMTGHVYAKLFGEEAAAADGDALSAEFMKYKDNDYPFSVAKTITKGTRSPARFWALVEKKAPLLSKLALRLFATAVNAASDKRFFSQAGIILTKLRNRLFQKLVTKMAQVRAELHRHRPTRKRKVASLAAAGEQGSAEQAAAAEQPGPALIDSDSILDQEELDAVVKEWWEKLDAEDLSDGSGAMVASEQHLLSKNPLSYIFGSPLEALETVEAPTMEEILMMQMHDDIGELDATVDVV